MSSIASYSTCYVSCYSFNFIFYDQDITCIKDLTSFYETANIEDIYLAYEQLKIDENSLFSCIGVAGTQAGEGVSGKIYIYEMNVALSNLTGNGISQVGKCLESETTRIRSIKYFFLSLILVV